MRAAHLLQCLCDVVERVDNSVIVQHLVCVERVIASAGAQYAIDELGLRWPRCQCEGVQEVFRVRLERG